MCSDVDETRETRGLFSIILPRKSKGRTQEARAFLATTRFGLLCSWGSAHRDKKYESGFVVQP